MARRALAWGTLLLVACDSSTAPAPDPLALTALVDINPDPGIVEVNLVAVPSSTELLAGKRADVWAYRDGSVTGSIATVPGPLLDVRLGERVIVHFSNELPEATTVHWHSTSCAAKGQADGQTARAPPVSV